jgi:hypothetical protein
MQLQGRGREVRRGNGLQRMSAREVKS